MTSSDLRPSVTIKAQRPKVHRVHRLWLVGSVCAGALMPMQAAIGQAVGTQPNPPSPPSIARPAAVTTSASQLSAIGPWGAAASSANFPALPATLWRNSDPRSLQALLNRAHVDQRVPVMNHLVRRVLLSGGQAPGTGDASDDAAMIARFDAASRFGPAKDAARLWEAVPRLLDRPELAVRAVDAYFWAGELERGCGIVRDIRITQANPILLEQAAVCYALQKETSAAQVAIDLARSERDQTPAGLQITNDSDWMEQIVVAMAADGAVRLPPFNADTARAFALSLASGTSPAAANPQSLSNPALSTLAGRAGPWQRAVASIAARQFGISAAEWAATLPAPAPQPVQQPTPPPPPPVTNGDTGVIVAAPPVPPAPPPVHGAVFAAELRATADGASRSAVARRLAPNFGDVLFPLPEDRALFAGAALWAGDVAQANRFMAMSPNGSDPRLMLAAALLSGAQPTAANAAVVTRVVERATDAVARNRAARLAAVAWAAGLPVSGGASAMADQAPTPIAVRAMALASMQLAASRGAVAETVLLAAEAMHGKAIYELDPATLVLVITSLRQVGLDGEARQLAAEIVLADLIPVMMSGPPTSTTPAQQTPATRPASPPSTPATRTAAPKQTPSATPTRPPAPPAARPATKAPATARPASPPPPPAATQRPTQPRPTAPRTTPAPPPPPATQRAPAPKATPKATPKTNTTTRPTWVNP